MSHHKKLIKDIGATGIALTFLFLAIALGKKSGASPWLTGVISVSLAVVAVGAYKYTKLDTNGRTYTLVMVASFLILSIAGIVNEYVKRFFNPSLLHVFIAIIPGFLFAAYCTFRERRASN